MIYDLQSKIKDVLKIGFEAPYFSKPGEVDLISKINFFNGTLPPKQPGEANNSQFPCCVVSMLNGEDDCNDKSFIKSFIYFGCYSGTDNHDQESYENGYHEIQNITERARLTLLKTQILDERYEIKKISWQVGDENGLHSHPIYDSQLVCVWQVPLINRELTKEELESIL